jgi:hypothetical protein
MVDSGEPKASEIINAFLEKSEMIRKIKQSVHVFIVGWKKL